jgi:conjugal transfer pilus assembly protein TraB
MSDLPPAELAGQSGEDVNSRTKRNQLLKWSLICAVVVIPLCLYAYSQLRGPPAKGLTKDAAIHVAATGQVAGAALNETPADQAEADKRAADEKLAVAQQTVADLQQKLSQAQAQQQADRQDATRTITALGRQVGIRPSSSSVDPREDGPSGADAGRAPAPPSGQGQRPRPGESLARRLPQGPRSTDDGAAASSGGLAMAAGGRRIEVITAGAASAAPASGPPTASADPAKPQAAADTKAYFSSRLEVYDSARYVPPNAYVQAKVLVGVDAATGTSYSQDPKPVLFRILGPATHVGFNGRLQTTDLSGCLINGAAYGELPSEKVYIKLQKITCPAGEGRFSVATVEGYVTSKGKAGVRGPVISREGQFTSRAMVAGILNGLGQGLSKNVQASQAGVATSITGAGALSARELSPGQIATGSVGAGVSQAASMLADYYIKRAEQYQPVIEMPTGVQVELVFLTGFQIK